MISEVDIWAAAMAFTTRYGEGALLEAAARADRLQEEGDWRGAVKWHRIVDWIQRLQAPART
jgi:hypothetical protein